MTKAKRASLADDLRQAIADSGITVYQLSNESGVHRSQLSRFTRGERDLSLSAADKLCEVLGLHLSAVEGFVAQWATAAPPAEGPETAPRKRRTRAPRGT